VQCELDLTQSHHPYWLKVAIRSMANDCPREKDIESVGKNPEG